MVAPTKYDLDFARCDELAVLFLIDVSSIVIRISNEHTLFPALKFTVEVSYSTYMPCHAFHSLTWRELVRTSIHRLMIPMLALALELHLEQQGRSRFLEVIIVTRQSRSD
jgi:hypothetical protein